MNLLTRKEAARRLTVSLRTLDSLIARGQLPAYRIGPKTVRIAEEDLDAYLEARRVAPARTRPAPITRPCLYVPGMKVV